MSTETAARSLQGNPLCPECETIMQVNHRIEVNLLPSIWECPDSLCTGERDYP